MIVDLDKPSPVMQQYMWEAEDSAIVGSDVMCNRCGKRSSWGWCPDCHPLHSKEI